jgi:hypothetical protein
MEYPRKLLKLISAATLVATVAAMTVGAGSAFADTYTSTATVTTLGSNTLDWSGQGTTNGSLDTVQCDTSNTAYLLWIFTSDGATLGSPDPVLTVGSDTYSGSNFGSVWHFNTPYYELSGLSASVTFDVTALGPNDQSEMNLTISHGCAGPQLAADPTIDKDAAQSYDLEYAWTISKAVDVASQTVDSGQPATFNYTVTVSHDSGTITNISDVTGDIVVSNPNAGDITLDSVTDELSDDTVCSVDVSGGLTVPAQGSATYPYTCGLSVLPGDFPNTTNTATMVWSDQTLSDGSFLKAGSTSWTVAVNFTENITDNCVDVTDSIAGDLSDGLVCVGDPGDVDGTFTFTYPETYYGPAAGTCQNIDNTATFADNSTPQNTDYATASVTLCSYVGRLTPGYWKNHQAQTTALLPQYLGTYGVTSWTKTSAVFSAMNCSNSSSQNAIGCLAGQLLAAELNEANGTNPCIASVVSLANTFLTNPPLTSVSFGAYTANSSHYTGPTGNYSSISSSQRSLAIALKTALDGYNNGGYCH